MATGARVWGGVLWLKFNNHEIGDCELVRRRACERGFGGIISEIINAPYPRGNRGLWRKANALNQLTVIVTAHSLRGAPCPASKPG